MFNQSDKAILAIDVHYNETCAKVAGVTFQNIHTEKPDQHFLTTINNVEAYESGKFYKRELPAILKLISEHSLKPKLIIIDGYVYLDGHSQAGLGKALYDSLDRQVPIIGVAKNRFKNISPKYELYRGESRRALFITSEGLNDGVAKSFIANMHGKHRYPTMLKLVDKLSRGEGSASV